MDDLARAVRRYDDLVNEHTRVLRRIAAAMPPSRSPRRWRGMLVVLLCLPAMLFGAAYGMWWWASYPSRACVGVTVNPTDDLAALIAANGTGTTFCLQSGTHRITASGGLTPKTSDQFIGVGANTTIDGAKVVTGWAASGSDWVATGFLPGTAPNGGGTCETASPLCNQPNDIFFDGTWLSPVSSQAALSSGKAYLDYAGNKIYIRDNPSGHTIEQSWASRLFTGSGDNVQIKNLTLQHAASISNTGAVDPGSGAAGWVLDHNEIRWNHGYGTGPGSASFGQTLGMTVTANNVHHNGQDGTGGDGEGNLVQANEVHHNSYAGYDVLWDGGNKFGHARNLVVTGNYYHDEKGPGIWCDINCEDITVSNNYVKNTQRGIMFEISCRASIHDNIVVDSADTTSTPTWGGIGILISTSEGAEVYNNQVYNSQHTIWAITQDRTGDPTDCTGGGEHVVKNLSVHDNIETFSAPDPPFGGKTGLWTDTGRTDLYSTLNNHFQNNTYHDTTPSSEWDWGMTSPPITSTLNFANFQAAGQDTAGSVVNGNPSPPSPPTLTVGPLP